MKVLRHISKELLKLIGIILLLALTYGVVSALAAAISFAPSICNHDGLCEITNTPLGLATWVFVGSVLVAFTYAPHQVVLLAVSIATYLAFKRVQESRRSTSITGQIDNS